MKYTVILLFILVFLSGCVQEKEQNQIELNVVHPKKAIYGNDFEIKFFLKNTFEDEIKNVFVKINSFDLLKFKKIEKCDGEIRENGCFFNKLEPDSEKQIIFIFELPENIYLPGSDIKVQPEFSINYYYSKQSVWKIPILGDNFKGSKNFLYPSIDGPIKIIMSIYSDEENIANKNIMSNDIFSIKIDLVDNENSNTIIKKDDFKITIDGFEIYNPERCSFEGSKELKPKEDIQLPMKRSLICMLKSKSIDPDKWDYGTIIIDYSYNYNIVKSIIIESSK
ncbi:MAG: hypothetical protein QXZ43_02735 [Candidatus Aenigmatarchaeota archaeon]